MHGTGGPERLDLSIDVERVAAVVLAVCLGFELAFVLLDYFVNFGRYARNPVVRQMFNITREDSLASWFAAAQTLLVAVTLWLTCLLAGRRPGPRWRRLAWLVLAAFFTYMAVDDGAEIHERLGAVSRMTSESRGEPLAYFPSYAWHVVFLPFFAALGAFMFAFLWCVLGGARARALLLLALACLVAAVVLDFLEGLDPRHPWNPYTALARQLELEAWTYGRFDRSEYRTLRHFSQSLEEALEMAANSLLWYLFLRHLAVVGEGVRLRLMARGKSAGPPADRGGDGAR